MASETLEIHRVQGDPDLDELTALYAELHEHQIAGAPKMAGFAARSAPEAWERRRERYIDWIGTAGSFILHAFSDGELVGFALVTLAGGYDGWDSQGSVGELKELVVASTHRGQGVGTALLERVERELRAAGVGAYRLNVVAGNDSALAFYDRSGLDVAATTLIEAL